MTAPDQPVVAQPGQRLPYRPAGRGELAAQLRLGRDGRADRKRSGADVALTTGFDQQVTDPLLAAIGWRVGEQLDAVVCADEVAAGRPAPDMIERAMELTGVTVPARVLVAGDTVLDVRAGHAAGAGVVVAVLTGAQTADELAAEHPTRLLDGVRELPGLLAAAPAGDPTAR
ncbi:HAD family hydrolase [Pseudonocardia sp.]|uniref:HAD family hydrolase n=1 Tax=Pseudonocardia sp. TaxID=60912 RepID=UPI0031FE33BD